MRNKWASAWIGVFMMIIGICTVVLSAEAAPKPGSIPVKIAHSNPVGSPPDLYCNLLKRSLELAAPEFKVEIYPASQLGDETARFQSVQLGTIQVNNAAVNNLEPLAPIVSVFSIPYMAESYDVLYRIQDGIWDELNKLIAKQSGLMVIGWTPRGYRHLTNSKRPIKMPADLKGLKIRIPNSPSFFEIYRAWGINPVPVPYPELFSALQQGVVDGQDNDYSSILDAKLYEYQKYVTEMHWTILMMANAVSLKWLDSLPAESRQAFLNVARAVSTVYREVHNSIAIRDRNRAIEKGLQLTVLEDERPFIEPTKAIWQKIYESADAEKKVLMDRIQKMKSQAK